MNRAFLAVCALVISGLAGCNVMDVISTEPSPAPEPTVAPSEPSEEEADTGDIPTGRI
ncbi:MAG: hypothetical protein AAF390_07970 [Pseudomonadota bacterium]